MPAGDVLPRRVGAALIDIGVILVLLLVIAGIFGDQNATAVREKIGGRGPAGLFLLLTFLYFFVSELAWAQTIGKRVLKLKVTCLDGTKPPAVPTLLRNVVRIIDWLPAAYVVGFISLIATGPRRQRLGDLVAKTYVVPLTNGVAAPPPDDEQPPPPSDDDVLASILR
jgi:uncharacterized RDD family membrane protein YckC